MPKKQEVGERLKKLRALVAHHHRLYHERDAPEISDTAYDSLITELAAIERAYPEFVSKDTPTQKVGGAPSEAFQKVPHRVRQWSFDNIFSEEELSEWLARTVRHLASHGIAPPKLTPVWGPQNYRTKIVLLL